MKGGLAKRLLSSTLFKGVGLVLMCLILSRIDYGKLAALFSDLSLRYLVVGLLLLLPAILLRVFRWNLILKKLGIVYPLITTLNIYWIGIFYGTLTPGKAGDLVKLIYLKADRHPLGDGVVSIILDRLSDLATIVLIGALASFTFLAWSSTLKIGIFVLLAAGGIYLLLFTDLFWRLGSKLLAGGVATALGTRLAGLRKRIFTVGRNLLLPLILLSLAAWAITFLMGYCIAKALGLSIPYLSICGIISLSSIVAILPISISGIGTRDGVIIILFAGIGFPKEAAVAFSLLLLFSILVNAFVGGVLYLLRPVPIPSLREMKQGAAVFLRGEEYTEHDAPHHSDRQVTTP